MSNVWSNIKSLLLVVALICGITAIGIVATNAIVNVLVSSESTQNDPRHLEWCDKIYHQNVGCPEFEQIDIPVEVLMQQEAQHLEWCDKIYHQNVSCPEFGQVDIPVEVLKQQEAQHLEWCDSINHRNVGCPKNPYYRPR